MTLLFDSKYDLFYRPFVQGMGEAVAKRTFLRQFKSGEYENWSDVAVRVAKGNTSIHESGANDLDALTKYIAKGSLLTSGRHLTHGDENQPLKTMTHFTNCSTSQLSSVMFYLLLHGSGVGRDYSDDMSVVDWSFLPRVLPCISDEHPDYQRNGDWTASADAIKLFGDKRKVIKECKDINGNEDVLWYYVEDSREGWVRTIELLELMAYEKKHKHKMVIMDFSNVRPYGALIKGWYNKPSSGPTHLMQTIEDINAICHQTSASYEPWEMAMRIDHAIALCVLAGGSRRSSRISVKWWRDRGIKKFISIKRDGGLTSSNNSVGVDEVFWAAVDGVGTPEDIALATDIYKSIIDENYDLGFGEPGFVNLHKLQSNLKGITDLDPENYIGYSGFELLEGTKSLVKEIYFCAINKKYQYIVNPCGEENLHILGGFCTIVDFCPYFCDSIDEIFDVVRFAARFLMRVNLMQSIYNAEVNRTNRIGISMVGIFEFAWKKFKYTFLDLLNEEKSQDFWNLLASIKDVIDDECVKYSQILGVNIPHSNTCQKPAGTISMPFMLTQGVHLPAKPRYVRWVQFRSDDPIVEKYKIDGYPVKPITVPSNTVIVGFPTELELAKIMPDESLLSVTDVTLEQQFQFIQLYEKYYIDGLKGATTGSQVSCSLKYNPLLINKEQFSDIIKQYQPLVKCATVIPNIDVVTDYSIYEYLPEEYVTHEQYNNLVASIKTLDNEDVDMVHIDCGGGACPIDFNKN